MPTKRDPSKQYHAAVALLAQSAEQDAANDLATILESTALAITLELLPDLSQACVRFWEAREKQLAAKTRGTKASAKSSSVRPADGHARSTSDRLSAPRGSRSRATGRSTRRPRKQR